MWKITELNSEISKLFKKLASNDIESILKNIQYFNYSSTEAKRVFIVNLNKILEEYKYFMYFDLIENFIFEKIDEFLFSEILLKIRFRKDEFDEFLEFFIKLKKAFHDGFKLKSGCKSDPIYLCLIIRFFYMTLQKFAASTKDLGRRPMTI
jgi:hypothetical protein